MTASNLTSLSPLTQHSYNIKINNFFMDDSTLISSSKAEMKHMLCHWGRCGMAMPYHLVTI